MKRRTSPSGSLAESLPKAAVFEWVSDARVTKFMPYNTYTDVKDVETWLRSVEEEDTEHHFGFVRKADGKLIGSGSIGPNEAGDTWEFGYNIRYDCWNRGYATEASRAMLKHAVGLGVTQFDAVDNPASGRVMEKCGLHLDHYGTYTSFDGLRTFNARFYKAAVTELIL